jgi:hypothetical protein
MQIARDMLMRIQEEIEVERKEKESEKVEGRMDCVRKEKIRLRIVGIYVNRDLEKKMNKIME